MEKRFLRILAILAILHSSFSMAADSKSRKKPAAKLSAAKSQKQKNSSQDPANNLKSNSHVKVLSEKNPNPIDKECSVLTPSEDGMVRKIIPCDQLDDL